MRFLQLDLFAKAVSFLEQRLRPSAAPVKKRKRTPACKEAAELKALWGALQREYFPERPDVLEYRVCWSARRQLRTLASCCPQKRKVNVAKELNHPMHDKWLGPLLHHEMCHAVMADRVREARGAIKLHGREFRQLERRHPLSRQLDQWIRAGGWLHAIRSARSREVHARRKTQKAAA